MTQAILAFIAGVAIATAAARYGRQPPPTSTDDYSLGFVDGWHESFTDSMAVDGYHRCADELPDDDDEAALAACWATELARAKDSTDQWYALTPEQRCTYAFKAFWRRDVGEPRRISRAKSKRLVEALRPFGNQAPR